MKNGVKILIGLILCSFIVIWGGIRIYSNIEFKQEAGGHLKRAADANTVELAAKEMDIALKYLEDNNLTTGYTSVIYKTPDEDIEFWYTNLKSATDELKKVGPDATQLEMSNLLLKLRETLLDPGEKKSELTVPEGISVYPHNVFYFWFGWVSLLLFCVGFVMIGVVLDE
jgi:hypothetical protein